jgi:hypothetical protein
MLALVLPVCFGFLNAAHAKEECFRDHLREAIELNEHRKPLYAKLTNFRSEEISERLIRHERMAIFGSRIFFNFDKDAEIYQKHGINIVCDEYVPMSLTPNFQAVSPLPHPDLRRFQEIDPYILARRIKRAQKKSYEELTKTAREVIHEIESTDARFNCMTRHLMESLGRISKLANEHAEKARKLRLPSPLKLSNRMISAHLYMLPAATEIDVLAAPIQAEGIAILCQDVPPIHF